MTRENVLKIEDFVNNEDVETANATVNDDLYEYMINRIQSDIGIVEPGDDVRITTLADMQKWIDDNCRFTGTLSKTRVKEFACNDFSKAAIKKQRFFYVSRNNFLLMRFRINRLSQQYAPHGNVGNNVIIAESRITEKEFYFCTPDEFEIAMFKNKS